MIILVIIAAALLATGTITLGTIIPSAHDPAAISLLPGTISADFADQCITIHTIDRDMPVWSTVHLLERRVAALFGIRAAGGRP